MEQRRLRLGDIVDDYCPRERRVTNHAIVAMVEEDVKQTRCTTCDAEHPYKGCQAPRRRSRKDSTGTLYKEVLAGITDSEHAAAPVLTPSPHLTPVSEPPQALEASSNGNGNGSHGESSDAAHGAAASDDSTNDVHAAVEEAPQVEAMTPIDAPEEMPAIAAAVEEGPVHRQLIRATLPRIE